MEANEWYDGEVSEREVTRRLMQALPALPAAKQQEEYDALTRGSRRRASKLAAMFFEASAKEAGRPKLHGDANVALGSVVANAREKFLEDVVTMVIRYAAMKTPVEGKPGYVSSRRGVTSGVIVNRNAGVEHGLGIEAEIAGDGFTIILSDLDDRNKRRWTFPDHATPASTAADLAHFGQGYLLGEPDRR